MSRAVELVDRGSNRGLGGDDGLDLVARHELDVVHREHIGRVDHRDRDRGACFGNGQDGVLARDVGGDDLDHRLVDLHRGEIDRGHAEVLRQRLDEVALGHMAELDQIGSEASALLFLESEGFLKLQLRDLSALDQGLAEFRGVGGGRPAWICRSRCLTDRHACSFLERSLGSRRTARKMR